MPPLTRLCQLEECTVTKHVEPLEFLLNTHAKALMVTDFRNQEKQALRDEYTTLFSHFPASTVAKVGNEQLSTSIGKATALIQLVNKHSGEVVEADVTRGGWSLQPSPPGSASGAWGRNGSAFQTENNRT